MHHNTRYKMMCLCTLLYVFRLITLLDYPQDTRVLNMILQPRTTVVPMESYSSCTWTREKSIIYCEQRITENKSQKKFVELQTNCFEFSTNIKIIVAFHSEMSSHQEGSTSYPSTVASTTFIYQAQYCNDECLISSHRSTARHTANTTLPYCTDAYNLNMQIRTARFGVLFVWRYHP